MPHARGVAPTLSIEPVGFGSTRAAVHQDTGRLEHVDKYAVRRQQPMQPKPVSTPLEAARHLRGPPRSVRARERSSAIGASSAPVSPPWIRCSLDFLAPVTRAATSHDEKLSSMAMWTMVSDGMVSGSRGWLRTPATLNVQSIGVRPHSI